MLDYPPGWPPDWLPLAEPLSRHLAPALPWRAATAAFGVVLWAVAFGGMAHLIAGIPPFRDFGAMTLAALAGPVLFAPVGVPRRRLGLSASPASAPGAPVFACRAACIGLREQQGDGARRACRGPARRRRETESRGAALRRWGPEPCAGALPRTVRQRDGERDDET
jgi:hypothetical protein